jgi:hypothetical protein
MNLSQHEADALALVEKHGGIRPASRASGINYSTLHGWLASAKAKTCGFEQPELPSDVLPLDDLLASRKRAYLQKKSYYESRKLVPIRITMGGPIGIVHMGDPHVDDDGTDIFALEHDAKVVRNTPGMMAGNVGDTTNNWVGRLARLYGQQTSSEADSWRLAEWYIELVSKWLFLIGGNHDLWSGAGNPLNWIAAMHGAKFEPSSVRMELEFPNGRRVRINARHDFAGHSQWNPAHGAMKATQLGWRDHILSCGHKHTSGYGILKCPATGLVSHALQVAGYKVYDRYGHEKGLPDQNISPCVVTIINPEAKDERSLVQVYWDIDQGAEYLTWLRAKEGKQ